MENSRKSALLFRGHFSRDALLFLREWTETKPFVHRARNRLVAYQCYIFGRDLRLQRGRAHPDRCHAAKRAAHVKIDLVARIKTAEIDLTVFDHKPPGLPAGAELGIEKIDRAAAIGKRGGSKVAAHIPHQ